MRTNTGPRKERRKLDVQASGCLAGGKLPPQRILRRRELVPARHPRRQVDVLPFRMPRRLQQFGELGKERIHETGDLAVRSLLDGNANTAITDPTAMVATVVPSSTSPG